MPDYTVHARRNGKYAVEYQCGQCAAPLESPLEEAGQTFACPTCAATVQTPGAKELEALREAELKADIQAKQARLKAAAISRTAQAQRATEAQQAVTTARQLSPLAFLLTLVAVLAIFYFAAVWPLQKKLRNVNGQLAETRARLDAETGADAENKPPAESQTKQQVPDSSAKQVVVDQQPTMADFKSFGDKFVEAWAKRVDHDGTKCTASITETDKRRTDSLLHPIIWVLLARLDSTNEQYRIYTGNSVTFRFYWDGKCWRGIESTIREDFDAGGQAKNVDEPIRATAVDETAVECQSH
jgi:uncharacterized Zn finger protein (UPF0148 family)